MTAVDSDAPGFCIQWTDSGGHVIVELGRPSFVVAWPEDVPGRPRPRRPFPFTEKLPWTLRITFASAASGIHLERSPAAANQVSKLSMSPSSPLRGNDESCITVVTEGWVDANYLIAEQRRVRGCGWPVALHIPFPSRLLA